MNRQNVAGTLGFAALAASFSLYGIYFVLFPGILATGSMFFDREQTFEMACSAVSFVRCDVLLVARPELLPYSSRERAMYSAAFCLPSIFFILGLWLEVQLSGAKRAIYLVSGLFCLVIAGVENDLLTSTNVVFPATWFVLSILGSVTFGDLIKQMVLLRFREGKGNRGAQNVALLKEQ